MYKFTFICLLLQSIIIIIQIANVESQPLRSTSRLHRAAKIADGGLEFAKKCSLTSVRLKGAIIAGRAVYKGIQTYKDSGDFGKASMAASKAGLENAIDVVMCIRSVKMVKLGVNVFNDLKNNESWGTILTNGGTGTIDLLPMGKHARIMTMKTAQAYRNGKSMKEAVTDGVKGTFPSLSSQQPPEKKAKVEESINMFKFSDENKQANSMELSPSGAEDKNDESGEKTLSSLSVSESKIIMAMTGLCAAQAIEEGKSVGEIIAEGFDGTLTRDANKIPTVKKLIELWENREKTLREEKIRSTSRILAKSH